MPFDHRSCRGAFQRLDDYLDRELTPHDMEAVRRHLGVCATCAEAFRAEADVLREVCGKLQRACMPPDVQARLWTVLEFGDRPSASPNGTWDPP